MECLGRFSSSSAYPISYLLFARGRCASWEIQCILWIQISGGGAVSQKWGTELHKILEGHIHPSSLLPTFVLGVSYVASSRDWSAPEAKLRPNFALYDRPFSVNLREGFANVRVKTKFNHRCSSSPARCFRFRYLARFQN